MNWDRIQGNWKQMKGKVKEKWGKLTDDEFDQMAGNRDQLVGKIQERYGMQKDEAERQVKDWESGCSHEKEKPQPAKWPFDPMQPGDHEPVRFREGQS